MAKLQDFVHQKYICICLLNPPENLTAKNLEKLARVEALDVMDERLVRFPGRKNALWDVHMKNSSQSGEFSQSYSSWWFQPIWKILVKMGIFPK